MNSVLNFVCCLKIRCRCIILKCKFTSKTNFSSNLCFVCFFTWKWFESENNRINNEKVIFKIEVTKCLQLRYCLRAFLCNHKHKVNKKINKKICNLTYFVSLLFLNNDNIKKRNLKKFQWVNGRNWKFRYICNLVCTKNQDIFH